MRVHIGAGLLVILVGGLAEQSAVAAGERDAEGQLGSLGKVTKRVQQFKDIEMTDAEEQQLGAAVSERIRARYGVVQDPEVTKYVTLVGAVLAQASERPSLNWTFIVLDTDGVNALAAPGGFVHITRGALSLMKNEAELGGVLGHEIIHVTAKHTIRAIQKNKMVQIGAQESLSGNAALFSQLVDKATEVVMAGFGRSEELEADAKGLVLANKVGYAPSGLGDFLTTLTERNQGSTEKQGLFASHPEMKERQEKLADTIKKQKLASTATVEARFTKNITYKPVPITEIATIDAGAAGLAGGSKPDGAKSDGAKSDGAKADGKDAQTAGAPSEEPKKKKGFGLSALTGGGGGEKKSAEVTGSGAARGLDNERNAKGGSNPKPVAVTVTAAEISQFKKDGGLS
jgi:beta-barrel assembly-enhancing protease